MLWNTPTGKKREKQFVSLVFELLFYHISALTSIKRLFSFVTQVLAAGSNLCQLVTRLFWNYLIQSTQNNPTAGLPLPCTVVRQSIGEEFDKYVAHTTNEVPNVNPSSKPSGITCQQLVTKEHAKWLNMYNTRAANTIFTLPIWRISLWLKNKPRGSPRKRKKFMVKAVACPTLALARYAVWKFEITVCEKPKKAAVAVNVP